MINLLKPASEIDENLRTDKRIGKGFSPTARNSLKEAVIGRSCIGKEELSSCLGISQVYPPLSYSIDALRATAQARDQKGGQSVVCCEVAEAICEQVAERLDRDLYLPYWQTLPK